MSRDYDDHIARTKGASPVALIDEREAFEDAWRAQYPDHGLTVFLRGLQDNARYTNTRTQDGWLMWQARALLAAQPAEHAPTEDEIHEAMVNHCDSNGYPVEPEIISSLAGLVATMIGEE